MYAFLFNISIVWNLTCFGSQWATWSWYENHNQISASRHGNADPLYEWSSPGYHYHIASATVRNPPWTAPDSSACWSAPPAALTRPNRKAFGDRKACHPIVKDANAINTFHINCHVQVCPDRDTIGEKVDTYLAYETYLIFYLPILSHNPVTMTMGAAHQCKHQEQRASWLHQGLRLYSK